jgi:hypothetical protein
MATVFFGTASQVIPSGGSRKDLREPPWSKNIDAPHSSGWIFLEYFVKKCRENGKDVCHLSVP